jgi:hypothetical protein
LDSADDDDDDGLVFKPIQDSIRSRTSSIGEAFSGALVVVVVATTVLIGVFRTVGRICFWDDDDDDSGMVEKQIRWNDSTHSITHSLLVDDKLGREMRCDALQ